MSNAETTEAIAEEIPKVTQPDTIFEAALHKNGVVNLRIGSDKPKSVTFESFVSFVSRSVEDENAGSESKEAQILIPPTNCIYYSTYKDTKNAVRKKDIMCLYPEKKAEVIFIDRKHTIVMPRILVKYTLSEVPKEREVWMLDTRLLRYYVAHRNDPMFYADLGFDKCEPGNSLDVLCMPNMYSDARMCLGKNSVPTRYEGTNFMVMNWLYDLIEASPFNNDLSMTSPRIGNMKAIYGDTSKFKLPSEVLSNRDGVHPESWFKFLACFDTFPYDVLERFNGAGGPDGPVGKVKEEYLVKK